MRNDRSDPETAREAAASPVRGAAKTSRAGSVLIATIDHPPVNALSQGVRASLMAALDEAEADESIETLVIAAKGRLFSAGGDITEFDGVLPHPLLSEMVARIDRFAKPVVAAIAGRALGGGLELALSCHGRVATAEARLGVPEVKLGILPGAGGIVRLPRLVGLDLAMRMIAEGIEIAAEEALASGLVDRIAPDPVAAAGEIGTAMARGEAPLRKASALPFPAFPEEAREAARKNLAQKLPRRQAPQTAIDLLGMAADRPFAEVAPHENAVSVELIASPQSRALRYLFAAERTAAKLDGAEGSATPREIRTAGVVGPGTMGRGIAAALLDAGIAVTLVGRSEESLERARQAIGKIYEGSVKRGKLTQDEVTARLARLVTTKSYGDLAKTDLVVETIAEDLAAKREAIAAVDATVSDRCVVATNTSYLRLEDLASATKRPRNFAGLHFFNPANLMKLVEIVRAPAAAPETMATLAALGRKLGKTVVTVGPSEGFVANRMLSKRTREALFLLEDGATPAQVDRVLADFGFPVGPFTLADMAGLDLMAATRAARAASMTERERGAGIAERLVAAGRLGRKSGAGYYAYGDDGKPKDDPAVAALLEQHRSERGIAARAVTDEEVLERCLLALVNEGARLIDEGVVKRAANIDVVWTSGLGFPAHLGGPMFWACELGLAKVRDRLDHYARLVGQEFFKPSPLIVRLAERGARFQ